MCLYLTESSKAFDSDLGLLAWRGEDVDGDSAVKALGPIYESRKNTDGSRFLAVHPFYSKLHDPVFERTRYEYLWPLFTVRDFKQQRNWRFLVIAHGIDFDRTDKHGPYRTRILPIYFQGRNSDGIDYLGIFPLGGKIYDILGRDEVTFVLFPVWMRHSVNDLVTTDWLWPIISKTTGPGVDRFRIFPFYGYSSDAGRYRKHFVLWPIWTHAEWYQPGESGSGFILFPLFGHTETEIEQTWNILPPFFRFTRGEQRDLTYAPWPIYQRVVGDDIDKLYLWPLWGRRATASQTTSFLLWPIGWRHTLQGQDFQRVRTMAIPFYYHSRTDLLQDKQVREASPVERYLKIWPLFSYHRSGDRTDFNSLALWPGRDLDPIERNWAPIWRIYTRSSKDDHSQTELLWGLYRHERKGEHATSTTLFPLFSRQRDGQKRGWSILNGLAGSKKNGKSRTWRLLYIFEFGNVGAEQ